MVWVQESRGVVEELYVLFIPADEQGGLHGAKGRGGLTRIVTMDMVVGATGARRVPLSFSMRVDVQKCQKFSRSLLLAVGQYVGIAGYTGYKYKSRRSVGDGGLERVVKQITGDLYYTHFPEGYAKSRVFPGTGPLALQETEDIRIYERASSQEDGGGHPTINSMSRGALPLRPLPRLKIKGPLRKIFVIRIARPHKCLSKDLLPPCPRLDKTRHGSIRVRLIIRQPPLM